MELEQSKRLIGICIIKVLEKHSDEEHKLTQQEIIDYLHKEFNIDCARRAVADNIDCLNKSGLYNIITSKNNGCYLENRDFEDEELIFLVDGLYASKIISLANKRALIRRLVTLGSASFQTDAKYIREFESPLVSPSNHNQMFWNLRMINRALSQERNVTFYYNKYGIDKKMHHTQETKYVASPHFVAASNGRYYMVCNYDKYPGLSHFRLDLISDIDILPQNNNVLQKNRDWTKYLNENAYMFGGESGRISFTVNESVIGAIIDWYGMDFSIVKCKGTENEYSVTLTANYNTFLYWALQYGKCITVTYPLSLRNEIKTAINEMVERYKD
ncbi:MAG: WYL domain-containing protein [Christensenellaceae bacterium]|jgi:predicted DNA-binding transcriptional regulator YafY|nr:WYL domain-containing protein [Christensenellaceae bacterium]